MQMHLSLLVFPGCFSGPLGECRRCTRAQTVGHTPEDSENLVAWRPPACTVYPHLRACTMRLFPGQERTGTPWPPSLKREQCHSWPGLLFLEGWLLSCCGHCAR
ncbi:hypothetical protein SEVIR_4G213801v4 [Setaria viridis]